MALLVPLSRFTSRVGGGSAFFVRHFMRLPRAFETRFNILPSDYSIILGLLVDVQDGSEQAFCPDIYRQFFHFVSDVVFVHRFSVITTVPNKSPEPTAVGAVSSAVAVHVASRRWLSFFR